VLAAVVAVAVFAGAGPSGGSARRRASSGGGAAGALGAADRRAAHGRAGAAYGRRVAGGTSGAGRPGTRTGRGTGTEVVPILMYHVINPPPSGAPFPGLYVPAPEFAEQMRSLSSAGFHAVTQDELWAAWREGPPLPPHPVVLTFDNGYSSQYTNALPVLRRLGWLGVENIQLTGLPPSQGGLSREQVRGLVAASWELDTQGFSHADLVTLDPAALHWQVAVARSEVRRLYGVPVNWFCYPSGHYDAAVIAAVRAAGYRGATTVVPGWARPGEDPLRLPRLRVLGGTTGPRLLEQIAAARSEPAPPPSYGSG
jgi:peptidoglycan/xylan/chitin deacetylase (PgdA/CDA1 family)